MKTLVRLVMASALAGALLAGCGAGGANSAASTVAPTGRAVLAIHWPAANGRLLPDAAQSVKVTASGPYGYQASRIVPRPTVAGGTTSAVFDPVPLGVLHFAAAAYGNSTADGVALASGSVAGEAVAGTPLNLTLTMASTIDHLAITPPTSTLAVGSTMQLTATAFDADGHVVLLSPGRVVWVSTQSAMLLVDVTGVALPSGITTNAKAFFAFPDPITVTAYDNESNKFASAQVTITQPVSVSLTPAGPVNLTLGQTQQFTAAVAGAANQAVHWSLPDANSGSIGADGLYTAPAVAGTYHLTASADASPTATKTVDIVVAAASVTVGVQ